MNSPTIILLLFLCGLLIALPRQRLALPFIMAACIVPMNQRIIVSGLDFTVLRLLVLLCVFRMLVRMEIRNIHWNKFDKLILSWNVIGTICYVFLNGTFQSLIYKCGTMFDSLGLYWIFRQHIQSLGEILQITKTFAIFAILSAPLLAIEKLQQTSLYSVFGPVGASFHRGRFRCAGPFPHYIMMGVFWSSLLPLFYSLIKVDTKAYLWLATVSALACIYFSASSTPILTVIAIFFFWRLYPYRTKGNSIFWSICIILLVMHLAMNAPVWHLMARVDLFGGSTGWHRYHLFNEFINHISEWFLFGTKSTSHWGYGLQDVTNQYVLEGVRGGFLTLSLFILIMFRAVKITGKYSLTVKDRSTQLISWGVCVSLLGHAITFFGVSYFGQILLLLYLTFAIVGFIEDKIIEMERDSDG